MNAAHDPAQYNAMARVKTTRHVSEDFLRRELQRVKWDPPVIALLFKDQPPKRVQIGEVMLVLKEGF